MKILESPWMLNEIQGLESPWKLQSVLESSWTSTLTKWFKENCKGNGANTKTFGVKFSDVEELTKDIDSRLLFCTESLRNAKCVLESPWKVLEFFVQKKRTNPDTRFQTWPLGRNYVITALRLERKQKIHFKFASVSPSPPPFLTHLKLKR